MILPEGNAWTYAFCHACLYHCGIAVVCPEVLQALRLYWSRVRESAIGGQEGADLQIHVCN